MVVVGLVHGTIGGRWGRKDNTDDFARCFGMQRSLRRLGRDDGLFHRRSRLARCLACDLPAWSSNSDLDLYVVQFKTLVLLGLRTGFLRMQVNLMQGSHLQYLRFVWQLISNLYYKCFYNMRHVKGVQYNLHSIFNMIQLGQYQW